MTKPDLSTGKTNDTTRTDDIEQIGDARGGIVVTVVRILKLLARPGLRKWRPVMALAVFLTLATAVLDVMSPIFLGNAINALSAGDGTMPGLQPAIAGMVVAMVLRFFAATLPQIRDALFAPVSADAQRLVSVDAFTCAQNLSLAFHQTRRAGALSRIIDRAAQAVDYLVRFLAFNIGPTLIRLVLASVVLGWVYDLRLSVIAFATIAAYVAWTLSITEWRVKQRRRLNSSDADLRAIAVDTLNNFETVKAFNAENRESVRYDTAMREYNCHHVRLARSMYLLNVGQVLFMNLGLLGVLALATHNVFTGRMLIGDVTAVYAILLGLYAPLNVLGWAWREIKQGSVDLEKLYGLMRMSPDIADRPGARNLEHVQGCVQFEAVSFRHDSRTNGIEQATFTIPSGGKVAFVGASGAGKSTLLKLLFRFYDVGSGRILIDGEDIRDVTQASLRRALGLVPQDVVLFNESIRFNIAYGQPEAGFAALRDAARQAQLLDFIETLPEGWDTRVGERGLKLSGGERQRMGIARVILANPAILVLDEATSALDSTTETAVQTALERASAGRTTLMIAHRLSTIRNADRIIVLNAGRIVGQGTHDMLLAAGGHYADMWTRQAAGGHHVPVK